jgi:hypothetical protein
MNIKIIIILLQLSSEPSHQVLCFRPCQPFKSWTSCYFFINDTKVGEPYDELLQLIAQNNWTLGKFYDDFHVVAIICRLGQAYQNGMCCTGDNHSILTASHYGHRNGPWHGHGRGPWLLSKINKHGWCCRWWCQGHRNMLVFVVVFHVKRRNPTVDSTTVQTVHPTQGSSRPPC